MLSGSLSTPSAKDTFLQAIDGYASIANYTLTDSNSTEITFSGIIQGFNYLQLRIYAKDFASADNFDGGASIQFNGDTGANYNSNYLTTDGATNSGANSTSRTGGIFYAAVGNTTYPSMYAATVIDIYDYDKTNKNKTALAWSGFNGISTGSSPIRNGFFANCWRNTAAITSITLKPATSSGYWKTGSQFSLYGIK